MLKKILKTQTILILLCFLILSTPLQATFAEYWVSDPINNISYLYNDNGTPILGTNGEQITRIDAAAGTEQLPNSDDVTLFPPTLDDPSNTTNNDSFAGKYYDPITETYWDSEEDQRLSNLGYDTVCTAPDNCTGQTNSSNSTNDPELAAVRREYNTAIARANSGGQGAAYAGSPAGIITGSSTTNSQGGATISAASCIGSQLLGKLLASTISNAVGNITNQLIDKASALAGAIISVPTNELGSVKYDTMRTKEQIQLQNSATVGTSVGFAGFNALVGVSWDSIAYCIVNSMIDYIARSTIAWAQSGFKGNPSFIQNPGQFFKQLADTEASTFLQNLAYGTIGQNICQPFRAQIVLNIARNYTGGSDQSQVVGGGPTNGYTTGGFNGATLPTGTLGKSATTPGALSTTRPTTVGNTLASKGFLSNGTYGGCSLDQINNNLKGFLNGNFNQGGWNSWLQLTQVPSNNPYSTYISLSAQLQGQIQKKKDLASRELNWGRGFLSFRKCDEKTKTTDQSKCPITTPGNLIQSQLEKTLGIPKDRLVLAQKFDQVIAVIVDQLIATALNKMLDVR